MCPIMQNYPKSARSIVRKGLAGLDLVRIPVRSEHQSNHLLPGIFYVRLKMGAGDAFKRVFHCPEKPLLEPNGLPSMKQRLF